MPKKFILNKGLPFAVRFVKAYFKKGRFRPREIPRLSIETTNICDAKCVFCANMIMQRKREILDMNLFRKAVDDFVAIGGTLIDFNAVIGDPLLDPYLLERARYVKEFPQFKTLGFDTNLQWLHKFNMDEFFSCGLTWVGISTVLSGRENYFRFFGVDRYEQTLKNILMLIEENKKRGHKLMHLFSIRPTSTSNRDLIKHPDFKMVSSLVDHDLLEQVTNESFYCDDWLGAIELPAYLKRRPLYPRFFRPCALLYAGLTLFSNGNIGACSCRDFEANSNLILGNIRQITIKEAWNGEKLAALRDDWRRRNKVPDICKRCTHYVY